MILSLGFFSINPESKIGFISEAKIILKASEAILGVEVEGLLTARSDFSSLPLVASTGRKESETESKIEKYKGFIPKWSRAKINFSCFLSNKAMANIPFKRSKHLVPHSSY